MFSIAEENLQELVVIERIETVIPITYILIFNMAYYGPNAEILGNIKLSIWHYEAVVDVQKHLKNMILLFGIDFLSAIITGTLLWTSCKINIFKVLKKLQKKLWLMMAMLEAYLFIEVKIKYYKNCMKIKGHSYFFV